MQLITLNTWGGRLGRKTLGRFFEQYRDSTDVFCFQEVWDGGFGHLDGSTQAGKPITFENVMADGAGFLAESLPGFKLYFRPHFYDYGILAAVRNGLTVAGEGEEYVYQQKGFIPGVEIGHHARNIQHVTLEINGRPMTVINFHGLWNGKGKGDCPERIEQSQRILEYTSTLDHPYLLCGDFNLMPDTQSLSMLEQSGLRNMITEYDITSTRTSHYPKEPKFADYILVSDGIQVQDFKVLPEEVSDHSALQIHFDI